VESSPDFVTVLDDQGIIAYISHAITELGGYTPAEVVGRPFLDFIHPDDLAGARADLTAVLHNGRSGAVRSTRRYRHKNGSWRHIESVSRNALQDLQVNGIIVSTRDVTEQQLASYKLRKVARARDALAQSASVLFHAEREDQLYGDICRVIVQSAGYRMAWVGVADRGKGKKVHPVAQFGYEADYLAKANISWDESERGRGPTGTAIRTGTTQVNQNVVTNPRMAPWRAEALRRGYASSAAFPLHNAQGTIGALTLYAIEADAFDTDELELLEQLAAQISYGIRSLHARKERERAEEALRESEQRFKAVLDQSIAGIYVLQDARFVYLNARMRELLGYAPDDPFDPDPLVHLAPDERTRFVERNARRLTAEPEGRHVVDVVRKDGAALKLSVHATRATYSGRSAIIALAEDATEKIRAQNEIDRYIARLKQAMQSTIDVVTAIGELRDPYTRGHERRVGEVAAAMAIEMGLDPARIEGIRIAGYLHDVGKIGVPAEILAKPARLTRLEFELVKVHAQQSYEILKGVDFPGPVAKAAWQHHERLDGSGYPRGLKAKDIDTEGCILGIADTVEAMASHRPYRPALGIEAALSEIEKFRGILYEPQAVDACLRLFREKGYRLPA
jgi:PAS domain S-box-containing protein